MRTQGRKEVAEQVTVAVLIAVGAELIGAAGYCLKHWTDAKRKSAKAAAKKAARARKC